MKQKKMLKNWALFVILAALFSVRAGFAQEGAVKTLVIDTAKLRTAPLAGAERSAAYTVIVAKEFNDSALDSLGNTCVGNPDAQSYMHHVEVFSGIIFDDEGFGPANHVLGNDGAYTVDLGETTFGDAVFGTLTAHRLSMDDAGPGGFHNEGNYVFRSDIAEGIAVISGEAGDVVVISKDKDLTVTKSTVKFDSKVAGVISTDPKIYMGAQEGYKPLALAGIVKCNVTTENGPIKRGDILVTSSEPGYAMRADDSQILPGMIVGSALDQLEQGKGKIDILIN